MTIIINRQVAIYSSMHTRATLAIYHCPYAYGAAICVWATRTCMGQLIPVRVPICAWAIPYTYGTDHTRMGKNMHMVRNSTKFL